MNIAKLLGALVRVVKNNPQLAVTTVSVVSAAVKEVKQAVKKKPTA